MTEKMAVLTATAGLVMVMIVMIGQKYDSQMLNIAWVIIAVKMADLFLVMGHNFKEIYQKEHNNKVKGKENEEHKKEN